MGLVFYMTVCRYVTLPVVMVIGRVTCPRTFVLFSCGCSRGGSALLEDRVARLEAGGHRAEVVGADAAGGQYAVLRRPLGVVQVGVHHSLGNDDAHVVAVLADDVHGGAGRDDGVALVAGDVADAEAGRDVAAAGAAATGVAVALAGVAAQQAAGGRAQREDADQADAGDASSGGTTQNAHGVSPRGR